MRWALGAISTTQRTGKCLGQLQKQEKTPEQIASCRLERGVACQHFSLGLLAFRMVTEYGSHSFLPSGLC